MQTRKLLSWLCCVMLAVSTIAAPVSEKHAKEAKDTAEVKRNANRVEDQEKELESLVALAEKPAKSNMQNVAIHKSRVVHYENTDGKEIKSEQTEEKVTDTVTGEMLSDIKQEVDTGKDETGKPETVVETKVDIPGQDIHKSFFSTGDQSEQNELSEQGWQVQDNLHGIEFTPTAIAEYLMKTWDFDNFYKALDELVDSSIMSHDEAEKYEQDVIREYQRISGDYNNVMDDVPPFVSQGFGMADEEIDKRTMPYPDDLYNEYYGDESQAADQLQLGEVQPDSEGEPETVESALDELLEDWWVQAFEAGEPRAQALVKYLYDVVAHDNNPDDMGQIKELLAEMLANALLEDLSVQKTFEEPSLKVKETNEKRSQVEATNQEEEDDTPSEEMQSGGEVALSGEETAAEQPKDQEKENSAGNDTPKTEEKTEKTEEKPDKKDTQVKM
ncbi:uncharacterized protein LOC121373335 isoform X2 [Gigantopelta aegis]|uniref:uncharacterized protein LOC121373335 isoform X2 n=1 Tax=Gigantopelta aegis TaxID=1735272 RepID=UPI001B8876F7|nr:uncharacterized protein LOC121373335 isoform X2 [Gigantopelta aegis]